MTKEELTAILAQALSKSRVISLAELVADNHLDPFEVLDLTFHQQDQVAFRAAWILENIYEHDPAAFLPLIGQLTEVFGQQQNFSAMRHFSKIACFLTAANAPSFIKEAVRHKDLSPMAETLFNWLIGEMPVAVKANAMEALANLVPRYDWIGEELNDTIDHLCEKESVAFFGRAKKVRQLLKLQKRQS